MRERLRDRYYSLRYRLSGHCWGCGRRALLHLLRRCQDTPAAILLPTSAAPVSRADADAMGMVR
jgi:hypothetical protein